MHTSKAVQSPQHQSSPAPAAKPVQDALPVSPSQQSAALAFRPVFPSLLLRALDPRDPDVVEIPAETSSPKLKPSSPNASDDRKRQGDDVIAPSAASSGIKRARDGKDGPDGKHSKAEHQNQEKPREKPVSKDREPSAQHGTESAPVQTSKRARKGSVGTKSGIISRAKPASDGPGQAESRSPRLKTISITSVSNHGTVTESETINPGTWKHGAQSPRKHSAQRASVTLSPRRSSNAGTLEPSSPARQTETLPSDKPAPGNTPSLTPDAFNDDFTFSACDLDQEGVIRVVSGLAVPETDGQTAPVPQPQEGTLSTANNGNAAPGRQAVPAQPGLSTEMAALLDDLDDMLGSEIKM
ncbi:hypothetical protein KTQ42_05605|uniref:hypothetical protein n=1 Tax=Noviherbaspirillum sp. L7-7A TaxID=2850560 RepID=UPI001C2B9A31|nr:hypothetical protein [Noviherbaspirillum sp. L7-7A]MBV0878780.1 hypothetical protein [Noviherbaspirillum sp. L7-7A]